MPRPKRPRRLRVSPDPEHRLLVVVHPAPSTSRQPRSARRSAGRPPLRSRNRTGSGSRSAPTMTRRKSRSLSTKETVLAFAWMTEPAARSLNASPVTRRFRARRAGVTTRGARSTSKRCSGEPRDTPGTSADISGWQRRCAPRLLLSATTTL